MSEESKNEIDINDNVIDIGEKFKNIKSIDELDFDKINELGRGKTPEDIEEKCLQICKDYLSGNWSQQTTDTIQVRRITGGMVNQIYYCGIRQPDDKATVPQEVAIRLYGVNLYSDDKQRLRDLVISLVFSERNLGPKIYGINEQGQIQKYYKHRQYIGADQKNPLLVRKVFTTLAQIHALKVPMKRNPNFLINWMNESLEKGFTKFPINQLIEENNLQTLKKYDLRTEVKWIEDNIKRINSPVLFTHNDYRSSNLLIVEPNDELVVCDYDLSGYGYRGYDFASILKEWGRKQFDMKSVEGILLGSEFKPMIEIYVEECVRIHGKSYSENPINSVDHILKEVKGFLLFHYLFFTTLILGGPMEEEKKEEEPPNPKLMMDFVEMGYKNYHTIKAKLMTQNIFD